MYKTQAWYLIFLYSSRPIWPSTHAQLWREDGKCGMQDIITYIWVVSWSLWVVIMTESIVSVVEHVVVIVHVVKPDEHIEVTNNDDTNDDWPARTEIQRRRHVGIQSAQSHASGLLGEGFLTFNHLTCKFNYRVTFTICQLLPLISWKWISQILSTTSSLSKVTNPKPRCLFVTLS